MVQGLSMVTLHWLDNFFFQVPPHYTSQPLHIDRACRRVASKYSWGHILLISHSTLPLSCIFETPFYRALPKTQHSLWSLGFFLTLTAFVFLCHFFSGHSHLTSAVIGGWSIGSEMTGWYRYHDCRDAKGIRLSIMFGSVTQSCPPGCVHSSHSRIEVCRDLLHKAQCDHKCFPGILSLRALPKTQHGLWSNG